MRITIESKFFLPICLLYLISQSTCSKKADFLNEKPNASLSTISSLDDCQKLLNNEAVFNTFDPGLGQVSTDDFYLTNSDWNLCTQSERNAYIWSKSVYPAGQVVQDWAAPYKQIWYANNVIDAIKAFNLPAEQATAGNQLRGAAIFFRSIAFYNLLQVFARPYNSVTARTDLGVPIRLSSDLNLPSVRSTVQECYDEIINDLSVAFPLLPATPSSPTQPSQAAVNGLLSRLYLVMGKYDLALQACKDCLSANSSLVDFNSISPANNTLITSGFLKEDIYHSTMYAYLSVVPALLAKVDSNLYMSYATNDLRRSVYFISKNGLPYFRGSYDKRANGYSGIAVDEIYLTMAECEARLGNITNAMTDLNTLLVKRWKTGTYQPYSASTTSDALTLILKERRKELLFRGVRWSDLRRLNFDNTTAITILRVLNGQTYTILPNDPRYVLPIPDDEISLSGIEQNPR